MVRSITWLNTMSIAKRIALLRKQKGFTQQALADTVDLHVTQIKRYEAGTSQPSIEAIKKIAKTLRVTTDSLIFEEDELAPDADLSMQFQAVSSMPEEQKGVIKQLLEGMIIKYETQKWSARTR